MDFKIKPHGIVFGPSFCRWRDDLVDRVEKGVTTPQDDWILEFLTYKFDLNGKSNVAHITIVDALFSTRQELIEKINHPRTYKPKCHKAPQIFVPEMITLCDEAVVVDNVVDAAVTVPVTEVPDGILIDAPVVLLDGYGDHICTDFVPNVFAKEDVETMDFNGCLLQHIDPTADNIWDEYLYVETVLSRRYPTCVISEVFLDQMDLPVAPHYDILYVDGRMIDLLNCQMQYLSSITSKLIRISDFKCPVSKTMIGLHPPGKKCVVFLDRGVAYVWIAHNLFTFRLHCNQVAVLECFYRGNFTFTVTDVILFDGVDVRDEEFCDRIKFVRDEQFPGFFANQFEFLLEHDKLDYHRPHKGYLLCHAYGRYCSSVTREKILLGSSSFVEFSFHVKNNDAGQSFLWARVGDLIVPYCEFDNHYNTDGSLCMIFSGGEWEFVSYESDDPLPNQYVDALRIEQFTAVDSDTEETFDFNFDHLINVMNRFFADSIEESLFA